MIAALRRRLSKISARILIVLAMPVVDILLLAGQVVWDRYRTATEMTQLSRLVDLSTRLSALVHEMQLEHGTSALFLGSNGQRFEQQLQAQRHATDSARTALQDALPGDIDINRRDALGDAIRSVIEQINGLEERRAAVTAQRVSGPANTAAYTASIMPMIDAIGRVVSESRDTTVTQALTIFYDLEQATERAGRERAVGALAFSQRSFDAALFRLYMSIVAEQDSYFRSYDVFATPADRDLMTRLVSGPEVAELLSLRRRLLDTPAGGSFGDVDSNHWFQIATLRIDLIRQVGTAIAERMTDVAETARRGAMRSLWTAAAVVGSLLVLGDVVGLRTARGIVRPVVAMTRAMHTLAAGDRSVEIPA